MDICIALTVFFDGQFYVGLLERRNRGEMNAARVVFGAEPSDAELLNWIISGYPGAVFSPGVYAPREVKLADNPKRRQRQATRALERGISTRSQQALALAREAAAAERHERAKLRREEYAERQFAIKQAKRKARHRGR